MNCDFDEIYTGEENNEEAFCENQMDSMLLNFKTKAALTQGKVKELLISITDETLEASRQVNGVNSRLENTFLEVALLKEISTLSLFIGDAYQDLQGHPCPCYFYKFSNTQSIDNLSKKNFKEENEIDYAYIFVKKDLYFFNRKEIKKNQKKLVKRFSDEELKNLEIQLNKFRDKSVDDIIDLSRDIPVGKIFKSLLKDGKCLSRSQLRILISNTTLDNNAIYRHQFTCELIDKIGTAISKGEFTDLTDDKEKILSLLCSHRSRIVINSATLLRHGSGFASFYQGPVSEARYKPISGIYNIFSTKATFFAPIIDQHKDDDVVPLINKAITDTVLNCYSGIFRGNLYGHHMFYLYSMKSSPIGMALKDLRHNIIINNSVSYLIFTAKEIFYIESPNIKLHQRHAINSEENVIRNLNEYFKIYTFLEYTAEPRLLLNKDLQKITELTGCKFACCRYRDDTNRNIVPKA